MPGVNSQEAINSYVAFFKESTFGSYPAAGATGATFMEFTACNIKSEIEKRKLDTIGRRGFTKQVPLNKTTAGSLEGFLHPIESVLPIACALGGGIDSTGTTSTGVTHTLKAANEAFTTPASLSFNTSKGGSLFGYKGGRVDSFTISAEAGEPVSVAYEMIFQDTHSVSAIGSSLNISAVLPFTFVQGVFRYSTTETLANTTTAEEPIQSFELTVSNNVIGDGDARQLGQNTPGVLPPTRRNVDFSTSQRFDTTTAYTRMVDNTSGAVRLKFVGEAWATGASYEAEISLPKVYYAGGTDPEIGGAADMLKADIVWNVVYDDPNTTTGKDIGITFINNVASY